MNYENIPNELRSLKQWGLFQKIWQPERNKYTKIPHNALNGGAGKSNAPSTWVDFETALEALKTYQMDGLAFFFANGYVGLDIDHIGDELDKFRSGDYQENTVSQAITMTKSYMEVSISGSGIHAIFKGKIPGTRRRKGNVEMYDSGRFFALTGNTIGQYQNEVNVVTTDVMKLMYHKYFGEDNVVTINNHNPIKPNDLDVDEVIKRAEMSRTGDRFKLFMNGGWEGFYPSQSEADLAFANDLAFWTGRDFNKMDQIFRTSNLFRPKYDEKHGKTTYGVALLNKAINEAHETFDPKRMPLRKYQFNFAKDEDKQAETPPRSWDDTGNADRFMDTFGKLVKYSYIDKCWYCYNGGYWETDNEGKVAQYIDMTVNNMRNEKLHVSADVDPEKAKEAWDKFLKKTRNNSSKKAILSEVQHRVPVLHGEFDQDKTLLNTSNGYVDLSSGILYEHDIKKMFSQQADVDYTDNIDCPEWSEFLDQIFDNDQELIHYIQKAVGYSATGSIKEQVMFILYGNGRNGKSIFIDTISDILGTYAKSMQADSIMVRQNSSGANSDIARLESARLVTSSEPNEGVRLDEGLVKQLTGGDKVTARYLYGKEFEFKPQFKLWLATNHKPIIRGTDDGIWRRLMLIPFKVQIPTDKVDKDLKYKLQRESIGILNWIVEGALMWQREGLNPPASVTNASRQYREEMDVISLFVNDCCEIGDNYKAPAGEIFKKYQSWANENSEYSMSKQKFGRELRQKFEMKRKANGRFYLGLKISQDSRLNWAK
ncbi:DNA primase [Levilactobacillus parabrevis]|uniref:phage/plasmid primase, P4 family n=1 Tax=Levilactobacillus parabrevis TaxID=357278 RepID=UPI0021A8BAB1|nr:phage/plasmid primase, P4 family [Levilactobacillus parabrevis]MCT4489801.1 DNA primase [Levilactobacillus parabrevis]